ncbi:MbtH family protein [[Actinomadura] parvosata]|uniref:MbtH family protein n=1 Tax=[Actinomadura] parvosata TaxID=1955412 RepID=UPI00406CA7DB
MTHPFDDPDRPYQVLVNAEGQHSLWPDGFEVPRGWLVAHPADTRSNCLRFIEGDSS